MFVVGVREVAPNMQITSALKFLLNKLSLTISIHCERGTQ